MQNYNDPLDSNGRLSNPIYTVYKTIQLDYIASCHWFEWGPSGVSNTLLYSDNGKEGEAGYTIHTWLCCDKHGTDGVFTYMYR